MKNLEQRWVNGSRIRKAVPPPEGDIDYILRGMLISEKCG